MVTILVALGAIGMFAFRTLGYGVSGGKVRIVGRLSVRLTRSERNVRKNFSEDCSWACCATGRRTVSGVKRLVEREWREESG